MYRDGRHSGGNLGVFFHDLTPWQESLAIEAVEGGLHHLKRIRS